MKKHIPTALLIAVMISTLTACGNRAENAEAESVEATVETENEVSTQDNKDEAATLPMTEEVKPVADVTSSPDAKTADAPKTTENPKSTAKPVVIETTKPDMQAANVTATPKPDATTAPRSTTTPTAAPETTEAPKAMESPVPTAVPATSTPAPTAAPVACQHTNTHVENSHDSYLVRIAGECYEQWRTATRVCNDCGANLGEGPDRVGDIHHGCTIREGKSATCTEDGYTSVESCDCGGRGEIGGNVIPAYGHSWHEEFDHSEETPNDDGISVTTKFYYHEICYNCGEISDTYEK